ncbi:uncharacterized protein LOC129716731 [Wyeomyia smithii]|uniref:uncharacterized protein LOC129716731 n=1 Tax=Wyeomyia smithii TaxID=174621 RepID=UPI002467E722|nr:uncharacterized protein LOC129716731 [Wyeomyia smithii]
MVWDAAAKANGVSFNDMLLKGTDLLVSLVEVLLRLREGKIAVCSDIREMFLRILIREEDKWSQCFLWRASPEDEVQIFVINVAMFGATSSPCTAQFVKNKNALDYAELYPKAVDAIVKNHYVDDFLSSVNSVEEAVQLVRQVQLIHAAGGFEFRKILSSSQEVLDLLGETGTSDSKSLNSRKERVYERVLGVVWVPRADHFTFDRTGLEGILEGGMIPTKRQVLRTVMKLYDPVRFVAHFVVQGKILMQEIWRTGTNWDEPISESLHNLWSRWIEVYLTISEVRVSRCFLGHLLPEEIDEIELHVFTDASVASCACVAYLRMSYSGGGWCSLVAAKTKVAPLRALSIPRLELEAAMMGSPFCRKFVRHLPSTFEDTSCGRIQLQCSHGSAQTVIDITNSFLSGLEKFFRSPAWTNGAMCHRSSMLRTTPQSGTRDPHLTQKTVGTRDHRFYETQKSSGLGSQ